MKICLINLFHDDAPRMYSIAYVQLFLFTFIFLKRIQTIFYAFESLCSNIVPWYHRYYFILADRISCSKWMMIRDNTGSFFFVSTKSTDELNVIPTKKESNFKSTLTDANVISMAIHIQMMVHDKRRLYQTAAVIVQRQLMRHRIANICHCHCAFYFFSFLFCRWFQVFSFPFWILFSFFLFTIAIESCDHHLLFFFVRRSKIECLFMIFMPCGF